MSCFQTEFNIPNDPNGAIEKMCLDIANGNKIKAITISTFFGSTRFADYLEKNTGERDYDTLRRTKFPTLRKLTREFYNEGHYQVSNTANRRQGNTYTFNFDSVESMREAEEHTITLITDEYLKSVRENISPKSVIESVSNIIFGNFIDYYGKSVWDSLPDYHKLKVKYKDTYTENFEARKRLQTELKEKVEAHKAEKIKDLKKSIANEIKTIRAELQQYDMELFLIISNVVAQEGNLSAKTYNVLAYNIVSNPNSWFDKVFSSSKINRYKKQFENVIDNSEIEVSYYEDERSFFNNEREDVDQESRRWDDVNKNTSFTEAVDLDVKLYLASIKHINSPNKIDVDGQKTWDYDRNNILGSTRTVGADYIMGQLIGVTSKYSLHMFIESMRNAAKSIKGLEFLAIIADDCVNNEELANRLFHELSGYVIEKTIIDIENNTFKNNISNGASNPVSAVFYNLENIAKFTVEDAYNANDIYVIDSLLSQLQDNIINAETIKYLGKRFETDIKSILYKYFPQLEPSAITSYLNSGNNHTDNYRNLLTQIKELVQQSEKLINQKNELLAEHSKKYKSYKEAAKAGMTGVVKPVFDYNRINYGVLSKPIINIAKMLQPHMAVRTELNSFNAEGNMGSDILGNNQLTNLMRQINFETEDDAFAGLRKLGEFVSAAPQYKYSPIFWGIYDTNGNIIQDGLFKRVGDKFEVTENAKKLINLSLFNGVRDIAAGDNKLYNNMSKVDYFLSTIIAFYNPSNSLNIYGESNMASYFLRTPSDAPKNFTITSKKILAEGLFTYDETEKTDYARNKWNELIKSGKLNIGINNRAKKGRTRSETTNANNIITADELFDLIYNTPDAINILGNVIERNDKTGYITYAVKIGKQCDETIKVTFAGKIDGNTLTDLKIDSTYSKLFNQGNQQQWDMFTTWFKNSAIKYGIDNNFIKRQVDRNHPIFRAFRQQALNEVNNFIFNLNNVFDTTSNDIVTKDSTHGLFDRYHTKDGVIVKDGKLVGNVFSFNRLFNTTNFSAAEALEEGLSLYGGAATSLFKRVNDNKLRLNTSHPAISINPRTNEISLNVNYINQLLDNVTERWLNDYVQDIAEQAKQYRTVIEDNFSKAEIEEAILNATIMYMNFDDLFEGDSKFYKNSRDFLKRAKEVQASGKSYSAVEFDGQLGGQLYQLKNLNNAPKEIKIGNKLIKIENGFKAVTIKNTVRPSDNAAAIYEEIKRVNSNLPASTKERIALQIAKGFGYKSKRDDTKTNDAQSYITIEEFIRRAYLSGELHYFEDILEDLLNPDADITKIDIAKINKFIQVQKNFYFDKQFDANTKTVYARQIKNAEFVLIPALIKGTSLEGLYNTMVKNGIGQVNTAETDKAAKRVVLEYWDNNGKVSDEAMAKFDIDMANTLNHETYYYRYLYKQQAVAQHMQDQRNKAGIQIMKKLIDNASPEIANHINNFFSAYIANIHSDYTNFLTKMGWREYNGKIVDANTDKTIKFDKFYKRAKEESERLGLDSNFADYVTLDEFGVPIMPDYMNIASTKFQSIAQSMFNNNILRQTLPGWHAAQITSVGYDANLKFDPESGIMEVLLPRWAVANGKELPRVERGSEEEKKLLEELNKEGLNLHIGYRIPTEGKQSVAILKVVGFLDDIQGSTIVVPDEWVTKTGSDFDVDSVYGISYQHKVDPKTDAITKIKPIIGENEHYDEKTTDTSNPAFQKRYRDYIRAELRKQLSDNREAVYEALSTETVKVQSQAQVINLLKSAAGINILVSKLGIMGANRFAELTVMEQQIPEARNNIILDSMIAIMESPTTREENYSRSNFNALTEAKDKIDALRKAYDISNKNEESVYNPFDQITYMENAMSGASLKAFSVTRDTFNSVANYANAVLNNKAAITVIYDLNAKDKNGNPLYDLNLIKQAYGDDVKPLPNNRVQVTHRKFAWSNNNRNVTGMLLTPYSSQTTAHILDAVKEGSIFNENKLTFGTFKTLIDLGIDYDTAIAFLQQPAITEIVNAYNEINSIYANVQGRPIEIALARMAAAAGYTINDKPISDNTSQYTIFKILAADMQLQNKVMELTGGQITENGTLNDGVFILDGKRLESRFKKAKISNADNSYTTETFIHDLLTLMHFTQIYNNTARLEKIIRCTNPDKFGAKQSVFATRTILSNIEEYLGNEDTEIRDLIMSDDVSLLEAIYPGIRDGNIDISKSKYPYLAAFMKYVTMTSIDVNKQLFSLESDDIYRQMLEIQNNIGVKFNDEKANAFKKYLIADIYASVPQFTTPYIVNEKGWFELVDDKELYGNNESFWSNEIDRINGYKQFTTANIEISNIAKPTQEDIKKFALLSPAQKIVFIKNNFKEDAGIFAYLNVNHFKNKDIIRYNDTLGDIENLYIAFNNAFFNSNPLIRLATLDLIKYAFVVEGFNFRKGAISKIVTNDTLLASTVEQGVGGITAEQNGIVATIRNAFANYIIDDNFIDKFVRSHSNYLKTVKVGKPYKGSFSEAFNNVFIKETGIFCINNDNQEHSKTLRSVLGIKVNEEGDILNDLKYVRISRTINKKQYNILYKLVYKETGIYGYPLNNLDFNETSDISYNNDNNRFKIAAYYEQVIDNFENNGAIPNLNVSDYTIGIHETVTIDKSSANVNYFNEVLDNGTPHEKAAIEKLVTDVAEYYYTPLEIRDNKFIFQSYAPFFKQNIKQGVKTIQNINIETEDSSITVPIVLERFKPSKTFYAAFYNTNPKKHFKLTPAESKVLAEIKNQGLKNVPPLYGGAITNQQELEQNDAVENDSDNLVDDTVDVRYSAIDEIDVTYLNIEHPFDSINQTAKDIADTIMSEHRKDRNDNTSNFVQKMNEVNLDIKNTDSLREHTDEIYHYAAEYYSNKAADLSARINNFVLDVDENLSYSVNDKELYDILEKYPDKYNELVKLILEAYTFGNQFVALHSLDIKGEDNALNTDITRLKNAINSIKNNTKIKQAMENIFNIYLAKAVSTNPMVADIFTSNGRSYGLTNLNKVFNDTGYFDSQISDIGFINQKQVQVVVKYINSRLNAITRFDIPEAMAEFEEEFNNIMAMAGTLNWDNIVDKDGYTIKPYTKEFKETMYNLLKEVREARDVSMDAYLAAKLKRDKWFAENINQPIVSEYYKAKVASEERAMNAARREYVEYQTLLQELRAISGNNAELDETQRVRRRELLNKISFFTSKFDEEGNVKPDDVLQRLNYIKEYIKTKRELRDKYFDTKILDEVKQQIDSYVEYIRNYDNNHTEKSLDEKLLDENYKEAYEWLEANTTKVIDKESNKKLLEAYEKMNYEENNRKILIAKILKGKDVYTNDKLDPSKISIEDARKIKAIYETEETDAYEDAGAETRLIKFVNRPDVVGNSAYYDLLKNVYGDREVDIQKGHVIKAINDILITAIDSNGELDISLLFSKDENTLNELVNKVRELQAFSSEGLTTQQKELLKDIFGQRISDKAKAKFREHKAWANTNLKGNKLDIFKELFCNTTKNNKINIKAPNPLFYGYRIPSKKYVDKEKTLAKKLINDNVTYTNKTIYDQTLKAYKEEAEATGDYTKYNEWYDANHIYNPATHKMEPIGIWRERVINPNGSLNATYEYNPAFEFTESEVKPEFVNDKFDPESKINWNGRNYRSSIAQNDKERAMQGFVERTIKRLSVSPGMANRANEGFMPRQAKINRDGKWYLRQGLGSLGIEWTSYHDKNYADNVGYQYESDATFSMAQELRKKGSIDLNTIKRENYATQEEYDNAIKEAKENNQAIDNELRDNNWEEVLKTFVREAMTYNAKESLKNTALLLMEDLKHRNAIKVNHKDNVSISRRRSTTHNEVANELAQTNTLAIVENWYRRLFRNEFKKKHNMNEAASLLQNITSAKYMVFNPLSGISNIWTGLGNILGETLAGDFLSHSDFAAANAQYGGNLFHFFGEMYSETSTSLTNALIKRFNVVDYEAMSERKVGESLSKYVTRFRNLMYGFQSGGEHYMQNTVMLGMLKSHRAYVNHKGKTVIGSFNNYIADIERGVLQDLIRDNAELWNLYINFVSDIQNSDSELYKYETLQKNICTEFINTFAKDITKDFIKAKKEAIANAEKTFYDDKAHPTVESMFELKNGMAVLKENAPITKVQLGSLVNKIIYVNKKIHGVYDKIGAAQIEKHWWGTLVMQYHKHLYPGFMKRWRLKGYYNEQLETYEKGSYISAINLLTINFDKAIANAKEDADGNKAKLIMKSVQNIALQALNNIQNINTNYHLLPKWEQNNIRRAYADSINTLACVVMAVGIHCLVSEDELKDSNLLSTAIYLADRFASEAQAFTPWGAYGEAKTLYSSPIASLNSPGDLIKLIGLTGQLLFDPDFETNYSTGLYKDRNKFEVLATRNIPIVRVKNRLEMMSKNNQYYRLNENMLKLVPTRYIADNIMGRN